MAILQDLKVGNKFKFASSQTVQTTTYAKGEKTWVEQFGLSTKGEVLKVNNRSIRVKLHFRDIDKLDETLSLKFRGNEGVKVELI